jgi:hypothetical protein
MKGTTVVSFDVDFDQLRRLYPGTDATVLQKLIDDTVRVRLADTLEKGMVRMPAVVAPITWTT